MAVDTDRIDHRKLPRRRGEELVAAILEATVAELSELGYAGVTMEGVAERARASKASLYRRWPSRAALVMDAVYTTVPQPESIPDTGSLREDLLEVLRRTAGMLAGPAGEGLRGLLAESLPDPERTAQLRARSQGMGHRIMKEIARRAAERGEIPTADLPPRRFDTGQALLRNHFLFHHAPVDDAMLVEIVETVLIPLFHAPQNPASPEP